MKIISKLLVSVLVLVAVAHSHEEIIKGQLLVQFQEPYRFQISLEGSSTGLTPSTTSATGLINVDNLSRQFGVYKIEKVITDPRLAHEEKDFGLDRLYLFYFPTTVNTAEIVAAYKKLSEVEEAWPNLALPVYDRPNDPQFGWHLNKCELPGAWDISHGDSSIVVCCVDNGVVWNHEDLEDNLWINTEEDINHDGKFTTADLDGIDNDGNGKVDDVIGWNFKHATPDPKPDIIDAYYASHGTNTTSAAVGVTNNGKGIASPGWSCRGMAINCDLDNAHINTTLAIQGIQYAAANGAKIINMSFGGTGYNPHAGAIDYAKARGCVLFGAAGNENTSTTSYPAGDPDVIAVAATDQQDTKSSYSNYGTWVDICAPGDNVIAAKLNNQYEGVYGTSIASPIAAGIAALLWAANPGWSRDQIQQQILNSCDPMPDPLYTGGQLGHGRINAYRAVGKGSRAYLTATNIKIDDSGANNNGIAEQGEAVKLIVTLLDSTGWQNATNVKATLTALDNTITITANSATYGTIAAGSSKDNASSPFAFTVAPSALSHKAVFSLQIQSTPPSYQTVDTLIVTIGKPKVLLVDDDNGKDYEKWYKSALDSAYANYGSWTVKTQGSPSAATLKAYSTVIWFTGDDTTTALTTDEINGLKEFLDAGRKLFISGQNIGQSISADPFYANYLHAQFQTAGTGKYFAYGMDDPIGQDDTLALAGTGGASNAKSNDGIAPVSPAQTIFKYKDTNYGAAVRFTGAYQVIYAAFPFEAIDGVGTRYLQKPALIQRILFQYNEIPVFEESPPVVSPLSKIEISPNPFHRTTTITYQLTAPAFVTLKVYDVSGTAVATLANESKQPGRFTVVWDGRDHAGTPVPAGVYFYHLEWNGKSSLEKAVLVK